MHSRDGNSHVSVGIIPRPGCQGGPPVDCDITEFSYWFLKHIENPVTEVIHSRLPAQPPVSKKEKEAEEAKQIKL